MKKEKKIPDKIKSLIVNKSALRSKKNEKKYLANVGPCGEGDAYMKVGWDKGIC